MSAHAEYRENHVEVALHQDSRCRSFDPNKRKADVDISRWGIWYEGGDQGMILKPFPQISQLKGLYSIGILRNFNSFEENRGIQLEL